MAYFVPLGIQKRLLRYALSRLELLDTNQLDLEKLDIALGKKSTVSLKDVEVNTEKLAALLHLTGRIQFLHARVLQLRVIIPADIYSTGIQIQIDGVDACAKLLRERHDEARTYEEKASVGQESKIRNSNEPAKAQNEGSDNYAISSEHIPTAEDLAKSFLHDEKKEGDKDLQDALKPQSQLPRESVILDDNDDIALDTGTGTALSMPRFLTNFLEGVSDRLQIAIENVQFTLQAAVELSRGNNVENREVPLSIIMGVRNIALNASNGSQGIRTIQLDGISGSLACEADVLASLSRVSSPSSLVSMGSPESSIRRVDLQPEQCGGERAQSELARDRENVLQSTNSLEDIVPSAENNTLPPLSSSLCVGSSYLDSSVLTDDSDRFADADKDEFKQRDSDEPQSKYRLANNAKATSSEVNNAARASNLDESVTSQYKPADPVVPISFDINTKTLPSTSIAAMQTTQVRDKFSSVHDIDHDAKEAPQLSISSIERRQDSPGQSQSRSSVRSRTNNNFSSSESSADNEDLARSTLFTHEEAASMYYSVNSNVFLKDKKKSAGSEFEERGQEKELKEADKVNQSYLQASGFAPDNDSVQGPKRDRTVAYHDKIFSDGDNSHYETAEHHTTKLFMSVDNATISFLSSHDASTVDENYSSSLCEQSEVNARRFHVEQDIPGAFSQYAEAGVRRQKQGSMAQSTRSRKQGFDAKQGQESVDESGGRAHTLRRARKVNFGSVSVDIDILRGRLICEVLNQILSSVQSGEVTDNNRDSHSPSETTKPTEIHVDNVMLRILGDANSHALDACNEAEGKGYKFGYYTSNLLKLSLTKIKVLSQSIVDAHQIDLSVLDLRLGFEKEDILSFDAKARMRTSARDLKEPQSNAMTCSILISEERTAIQLSTLPVFVLLDIHKIDDFLGACGGVGSIIELGTSINSNSTIQRVSQAERHRLKNNNFSDKQSDQHGLTAQVKCNARIAGSLITLRARSCSLSARTSAIKLIHRAENTAVQIDEVEIKNPQVETDFVNDLPLLQLKNNRIQFLSVPEEDDLGQLVTLIAPSVGGYEDNDDVLLDTLVAQRKKGSSLRTTTSVVKLNLPQLRNVKLYQGLSDELAKLTAVKKYFPAESRPGMLLLVSVEQLDVIADNLDDIGPVSLQCQKISIAYVAVPILLASSIGNIVAKYQTNIELVHRVSGISELSNVPMALACFVGDDLESTLKIKLNNFCCEYSVPTMMAFAKLIEEVTLEKSILNKGISVATVTENFSQKNLANPSCESTPFFQNQSFRLKIFLQNCALGLNPRLFRSKGLLVFTNAKFSMVPEGNNIKSNLHLRKATLLVVDEASRIKDEASAAWMHRNKADSGGNYLQHLCSLGYVSVSTISSANASVNIIDHGELAAVRRSIDVDLKNELFIIETCADSTQTTLEILNGLRVPSKPNKDAQFRTEVMPMQDIMASFSGDAFSELDNENSQDLIDPMVESMLDDGEVSEDLELTKSLNNLETMPFFENLDQNLLDDDLESVASLDTAHRSEQNVQNQASITSKIEETRKVNLDFEEQYFSTQYSGSISRQKGATSEGDSANEIKLEHLRSPLTVNLRDVHVIWNLFDGYDWPATRETIATAVNDLEMKAEERRKEREKHKEPEEDQPVIGDYLFNSIWIDIPPNKNPHDLSAQVSRDVNDRASETGSYSTSAVSHSPNRLPRARSRSKRLKLARGRHHKITFELRGVSADIVVFPPGIGETQSSIDMSVMDFEVFDHVPSSTWKKFATYMHDAGEREMGRPMVRFEIFNVKPVPELAASELVLRASILPLRLHVDQDALDFIIRFFEFKNKSDNETVEQEEKAFLQRVEINTIMLKLDYKPKKVDYTGLHSGHTNELMNFFILDGSDIILRHVILYGVSGFDKLHKTLNDIWMPDVKRNQLPGVLAGLAPVRSLVNVGGGVRDLVVIPMREYRKDGRVVRSIRKGALAFAKTTTSELARFGAKLAIGTQNVLQGTEDILANPTERKLASHDWDTKTDEYNNSTSDALKSPLPPPSTSSLSSSPSSGPNPVRAVSNYADQPIGVLAGMRGAVRSLERDLLTARDAVIAIQGEVMESNSAGAAAKAVARRAPTVVLRPAIGASKAVGMTLLGAGNALDKDSRRRIEDKYKRI